MSSEIKIKKLFGKRIKKLRLKRGLTKGKLGEMINVVERNMSKIECGKSFVTAETLEKMIIALDVEPYELFNFDHHNEVYKLKAELIEAVENETVDIKILYSLYKTIKNTNF